MFLHVLFLHLFQGSKTWQKQILIIFRIKGGLLGEFSIPYIAKHVVSATSVGTSSKQEGTEIKRDTADFVLAS